MSKQYGLIKPDKAKKPGGIQNVFGSDSDDDEVPKKKICSTGINMAQKKQIELMQEQAMAEDPSIFQYDEVYDDIQTKRTEAIQANKTAESRKPKYIGKLLETADKRKKEYERRIERQVQKEREAEGEQFKDKESFVTSSYRKKLEEMKAAEEQEKREEYLEAIGDVTKQQDLSGFYRHLYSQKMGGDEKKNDESAKLKKNYRKRRSSEEKSDDEQKAKNEKIQAHLPSNLDADSDFSIESSDSEKEEDAVKKEDPPKEAPIQETPNEEAKIEEQIKIEEIPKDVQVENKPKEKIDIWKKRTVGEVFDQALQRFFERKAIREQG